MRFSAVQTPAPLGNVLNDSCGMRVDFPIMPATTPRDDYRWARD